MRHVIPVCGTTCRLGRLCSVHRNVHCCPLTGPNAAEFIRTITTTKPESFQCARVSVVRCPLPLDRHLDSLLFTYQLDNIFFFCRVETYNWAVRVCVCVWFFWLGTIQLRHHCTSVAAMPQCWWHERQRDCDAPHFWDTAPVAASVRLCACECCIGMRACLAPPSVSNPLRFLLGRRVRVHTHTQTRTRARLYRDRQTVLERLSRILIGREQIRLFS